MIRFMLFATLFAAPAFADCPDPNLNGPEHSATGPSLIIPQSWRVRAEGDSEIPCADWDSNAMRLNDLSGRLPVAPTAQFQLAGLGPHILMVMAEASCGAVLAARGQDGLWYFGEEKNGREEIVLWGAADGILQVWVGSRTDDGCDGTLTLETFDR